MENIIILVIICKKGFLKKKNNIVGKWFMFFC